VRVLLDEQLPRQLAAYLVGHETVTVQRQGWAGARNGELLRRAVEAGFDVFVTADRNLQFQQNLRSVGLRIVLLRAPSNALEDLLPLVPETLEVLKSIEPGQIGRVGSGTGSDDA
jgi:predicted nuclease of predicted toxin-antitoxin system